MPLKGPEGKQRDGSLLDSYRCLNAQGAAPGAAPGVVPGAAPGATPGATPGAAPGVVPGAARLPRLSQGCSL